MSILKFNFKFFIIIPNIYLPKILVFGDIDNELNNCNTIIRNELRK